MKARVEKSVCSFDSLNVYLTRNENEDGGVEVARLLDWRIKRPCDGAQPTFAGRVDEVVELVNSLEAQLREAGVQSTMASAVDTLRSEVGSLTQALKDANAKTEAQARTTRDTVARLAAKTDENARLRRRLPGGEDETHDAPASGSYVGVVVGAELLAEIDRLKQALAAEAAINKRHERVLDARPKLSWIRECVDTALAEIETLQAVETLQLRARCWLDSRLGASEKIDRLNNAARVLLQIAPWRCANNSSGEKASC